MSPGRFSVVLATLFALGSPVAAVVLPGCQSVVAPSKVAQGERYTTGDVRYDGFFSAVHEQRGAAAAWGEQKTHARKTLVILLGVTSSTPDDVLVRGTRDRAHGMGGAGARLDLTQPQVVLGAGAKADAPLFAAVTDTARRELERARRLVATAEHLEELRAQGEELKRLAAEDQANAGADKADDEKMDRQREIRRELGAAVDVVSDLARDARRHLKDAEAFLDGLDAALQDKEPSAMKRADAAPFPPPPPPVHADPPPVEPIEKAVEKPGPRPKARRDRP